MKVCPRLTEMGVMHPQQIEKFLVNSISNCDILRIVYRRRKGSLLPASRTYKFPRIQKSVTVDHDPNQTQTVMETDPVLRSAVSELQEILKATEHKQSVSELIIEEIQLLEEDIALRSGYIKELAEKI